LKFLILTALVFGIFVISLGITPTAHAWSYPIVATIDVPGKPYSIIYDPVDGKIYVGTAVSPNSPWDNHISVIS